MFSVSVMTKCARLLLNGRPVDMWRRANLTVTNFVWSCRAAGCVVNSLWPVEDAPTQLYMEAFHERARFGDYAGGWILARDRLRKAGYPPSVYGSFILGGAGRPSENYAINIVEPVVFRATKSLWAWMVSDSG